MSQLSEPLDSHAKFRRSLVPGIRVKVVWRAVGELVALAELTAHKEAHRGKANTDRYPTDRTQSSGRGWFIGVNGVVGFVIRHGGFSLEKLHFEHPLKLLGSFA